jgi:hypothetical protein
MALVLLAVVEALVRGLMGWYVVRVPVSVIVVILPVLVFTSKSARLERDFVQTIVPFEVRSLVRMLFVE